MMIERKYANKEPSQCKRSGNDDNRGIMAIPRNQRGKKVCLQRDYAYTVQTGGYSSAAIMKRSKTTGGGRCKRGCLAMIQSNRGIIFTGMSKMLRKEMELINN